MGQISRFARNDKSGLTGIPNRDRDFAGMNHHKQVIHIDSQPSRCYKRELKSYWRQSLADHPSVEKRYRQSVKRRTRNIEIKSRLRTLMKKARQAIEANNQEVTNSQIQGVNKALGKAVSKGIVKKNTASRWLSRLSRSAHRSKPAS